MVDVRTELSLINKHIRQHNREAGEHVVWFEFLEPDGTSATTVRDDVYDMGSPVAGEGRKYAPGIVIPTIYVDEMEDQFYADQDGRQPIQNIRVVMLFDDAYRAGMTTPHEYQPHLNDMFYFDGRYFKIYTYQVRGRLQNEVVIAVNGYEVYIDQEMSFDPGPESPSIQDLDWPTSFPSLV